MPFLAGCALASSPDRKAPYEGWAIYTELDIVASHVVGPFDVEMLKSVDPKKVNLDSETMLNLASALERAKIGKATSAEKKQMRGPIYLAIFRSNRRQPVYISNGCHVLSLETNNLYRLESEAAVSILGIPVKSYESRLCKEPGLGITLSPR